MAGDLFPMDLTVPGMLLAGGWRTKEQIAKMDAAAQRAALIEALLQNSSETKEDLVRYSDHDLVGSAALIVFLLRSGIRDRNALVASKSDDHRNTVIVHAAGETGRLGEEFWGHDNHFLIRVCSQWYPARKRANDPKTVEKPVFGETDGTDVDAMALGYFQMLHETARTHFIANRRKEALDRTMWVFNTLPYQPKITGTPSDGFTQFVKPLSAAVTATKNNLKDGRDYFGHTSEDVPSGSLKFYEDKVNGIMESLGYIEEQFGAYKKHGREQQETRADYEDAFTKASDLLDKTTDDLDWTRKMIEIATKTIKDTGDEMDEARKEFERKLVGLEKDIRGTFGVPGPKELASVLLNLSFMPEKSAAKVAMVGSQALTLASDTSDAMNTMTLDDGSKMDEKLVVSRLEVVGSDVKDFSPQFETLKNGYLGKNNGIYRIVQDAKSFKTLCQTFYSTQKNAPEVVEALETFLRKALFRNAKIDEYNALWSRAIELQGQLTKLEGDARATGLALSRNEDPSLVYRVTAITNLYNRARDTALGYVDQMGRAYAFWSLKPYDKLTEVCPLADADTITRATLESARIKVSNLHSTHTGSVMASFREGCQPPEDADKKTATGLHVELSRDSHKEFIDNLIKNGEANFELTLDHPKFADLFNIRLRRVRAWIHGLEPADTIHEVDIMHSGPDQILDSNRKIVKFTHEPVLVKFRYDSKKGIEDPRAIYEGREGCREGDLTNPDFAPIGPFTTWNISLLNTANKDLKRDKIEKVVMEFHIMSQATSPKPKPVTG